MATRENRLNEFRQDAPPLREPVELLCEDHNGTDLLPYEGRWIDALFRPAAPINLCLCGRLKEGFTLLRDHRKPLNFCFGALQSGTHCY
jgi:hypothetical protein